MAAATMYIWATPFVRQVLHVHEPYARQWVMFGGYARDTCLVEFTQIVDGDPVEVDRFSLLGFDRPRHSPGWARFASRRDGGEVMSRRICTALGEGADLRMDLRCLEGRVGWKQLGDPHENVCDRPAPARSIRRRR